MYLAKIGGTEYQGRISRHESYCRHQILYCAKGCGTLKYDDVTVTSACGNRLISAQIAKQCGFSDAGNFCTVFRKHENLPPIE